MYSLGDKSRKARGNARRPILESSAPRGALHSSISTVCLWPISCEFSISFIQFLMVRHCWMLWQWPRQSAPATSTRLGVWPDCPFTSFVPHLPVCRIWNAACEGETFTAPLPAHPLRWVQHQHVAQTKSRVSEEILYLALGYSPRSSQGCVP